MGSEINLLTARSFCKHLARQQQEDLRKSIEWNFAAQPASHVRARARVHEHGTLFCIARACAGVIERLTWSKQAQLA